jgi:hypothetical protein
VRRWVCPPLSAQSTVAAWRLITITAERAFWHDGMLCYGQFFSTKTSSSPYIQYFLIVPIPIVSSSILTVFCFLFPTLSIPCRYSWWWESRKIASVEILTVRTGGIHCGCWNKMLCNCFWQILLQVYSIWEKFEVLTSVQISIVVYWDVTPCRVEVC